MRDTRKDKAYFEKYLEYQYSRIDKKVAKLNESDEEKKQRILISLTGFELELLKAEFSIGATKDKMKTLLNNAIEIADKYNNITYDDLLNLLSVAVMVNDKSEACKLIKSNIARIEKDRLLKYISLYIQDRTPIWDNNLKLNDEFSDLDQLFKTDDKESSLLVYLNSWYKKHSGYGWYNSHLSSSDTYCGYWSFESAAITSILGINEVALRNSIFYPSFE